MPTSSVEPFDVCELISQILEEERISICTRNLLVLRELERQKPTALGVPQFLRTALQGLLQRIFSSMPEGGDFYVASRYHATGILETAAIRILIRLASSVELQRLAPELALVEYAAGASGGRTQVETEGGEMVITIDLPAPS